MASVRVEVRGVRGAPAPERLKATVSFDGGWLGEAEISLAGASVSDAQLQGLAGLGALRKLALDNTEVGDLGMRHLAALNFFRISRTNMIDAPAVPENTQINLSK